MDPSLTNHYGRTTWHEDISPLPDVLVSDLWSFFRKENPNSLQEAGSFYFLTCDPMAHMLVTMYGLEKDVVESMLHEHTKKRTFDGIDLEHIWKNSEDEEEVIFLFRTDHPERARTLLTRIHEDIQIRHPEILAPEIILLKK